MYKIKKKSLKRRNKRSLRRSKSKTKRHSKKRHSLLHQLGGFVRSLTRQQFRIK